MQKINELRLFLLGETLTKQQKIIFEIFNKQNEAVVVLKPSGDKEPTSSVVYANDRFANLVKTEDTLQGVEQPLLRVKQDKSTDSLKNSEPD